MMIAPAARSLAATGASFFGTKFFSAGADLKLFASGDKGVAATMARRFGVAFEALATFRGVSIAAINGYAMGGGLECALACDLRIASDKAKLTTAFAKVGFGGDFGITWPLTRLLGEAKAKELLANPAGEEQVVGNHPDTGLQIVAKNGRFGPYVTEVLPDEPLLVMADAAVLQRVLVNLLGNAIKFTERGTVRLRVERVEPGAAREVVHARKAARAAGLHQALGGRLREAADHAQA